MHKRRGRMRRKYFFGKYLLSIVSLCFRIKFPNNNRDYWCGFFDYNHSYKPKALIFLERALYFSYRYFKMYDPDLHLNKNLLSFETLSLLIIFGTFFLNNSRLFQTDPFIKIKIYFDNKLLKFIN